MEENPNDKILREKLQSANYPFEPAAWAGMEKMLNSKKKRRGVFWWTALGIAASLLLGAGIYLGMNRTTADKNAIALAPTEMQQTTQQTTTSDNADKQSNKTSPLANDVSHSTNTNMLNSVTSGSSVAAMADGGSKHKAARPQSWNGMQYPYSNEVYPVTASATERVRSITEASQIELGFEPINTINYNCLSEETEEPAVASIPAKLKKKIHITYKLGVEADLYEGFAKKTFADGPTWGVGISQEVAIGKYFAITNSILYSEVNFKINNPKYPDNNYSALISYRSHIKEMAIPIGVKVYPYSNKLVKISVGASYVNHIKLKESFDYKLKPIVSQFTTTDVNPFFPGVNSFNNQNLPNSVGVYSPPPSRGSVLSDYYSLGNAKRYYGSLAYTVGVEIALPKRFLISAEPCMMMSLDKIKMQNSRVFDFGLNTGVKYAF